jgi:hypothetical protein
MTSARHLLRRLSLRPFPIIGDLPSASLSDWREAFKEVFIITFFSLMPIWLGLLVVTIITISEGTGSFIENFASSSDLGILSASLLGPSLYTMFREQVGSNTNEVVPRFPSGLWFTIIIIACCVVATVIYCLTYLSGIHAFFDRAGHPINFVNAQSVAVTSWTLFGVSIGLIFFAATIRNSIETQPPNMMSADTQDFVEQFRAAQTGNQQ